MKIIIYIILGLSIILNIYLICKSNGSDYDIDTKYNIIDSLENEREIIENRKDSVRIVIDTLYIKLKSNETKFENMRSNIINNDVNEDYIFFSEYIRQYTDSSNNNYTTQNGKSDIR